MNDELEIEQEEGGDEAAAKIRKLKEELKLCQKEKADNLLGWQRSQADFINYRRRQEEGAAELIKLSCASIIKDILPLLDSIEAGIKNIEPRIKEQESRAGENRIEEADGLWLILKQLTEILKRRGLEEIKATGEKFNPELHEAVEQIEASDKEEGIILEVAQKGYLINGKVLRTAKVKVAK